MLSLLAEELCPLALLLCRAVAISVAILSVLGTAVVDDNAEMIEFLLLVQALQFRQVATVHLRFAQYVDGQLSYAINDAGICHDLSGHVVDDDVVVEFLEFLHALFQPVAHQQLGRIAGP